MAEIHLQFSSRETYMNWSLKCNKSYSAWAEEQQIAENEYNIIDQWSGFLYH